MVARYLDDNPNGSLHDIAGITNEAGNVVGLMPHPEHAVEDLTGAGTDGLGFFAGLAALSAALRYLARRRPLASPAQVAGFATPEAFRPTACCQVAHGHVRVHRRRARRRAGPCRGSRRRGSAAGRGPPEPVEPSLRTGCLAGRRAGSSTTRRFQYECARSPCAFCQAFIAVTVAAVSVPVIRPAYAFCSVSRHCIALIRAGSDVAPMRG